MTGTSLLLLTQYTYNTPHSMVNSVDTVQQSLVQLAGFARQVDVKKSQVTHIHLFWMRLQEPSFFYLMLLVITDTTATDDLVVTSTNVEVMRSVHFVCQSVSRITTKVISRFHWNSALRLGLPTDELLVTDLDSGSLFLFPRHWRIRDFRRFIIISYTVSSRFSRHSAKWLMQTK